MPYNELQRFTHGNELVRNTIAQSVLMVHSISSTNLASWHGLQAIDGAIGRILRFIAYAYRVRWELTGRIRVYQSLPYTDEVLTLTMIFFRLNTAQCVRSTFRVDQGRERAF